MNIISVNYKIKMKNMTLYITLPISRGLGIFMELFAKIAARYAEKSPMEHMHGCLAILDGRYIVAQAANRFRKKGKDRL